MIVKLKDIPADGKNIEYDLDIESLNSRVNSSNYTFDNAPKANLNLILNSNTVVVKGDIIGEYCTACSRCNNKVTKDFKVPFKIILKPKDLDADSKSEELEDVNFGYYLEDKVNCSEIAEEYLMLSLPMVTQCERKECVSNGDSWQFGEEIESNNPFKNIKLH